MEEEESHIATQGQQQKHEERRRYLTTPNCSDALAFQSLRLVSSLPEIT